MSKVLERMLAVHGIEELILINGEETGVLQRATEEVREEYGCDYVFFPGILPGDEPERRWRGDAEMIQHLYADGWRFNKELLVEHEELHTDTGVYDE